MNQVQDLAREQLLEREGAYKATSLVFLQSMRVGTNANKSVPEHEHHGIAAAKQSGRIEKASAKPNGIFGGKD